MKSSKILSMTFITALLVWALIPVRANASAPTDQVRATADKVLAILRDPNLKGESKKQERRSQLREVISARFDFNEMAKRSLGPTWGRVKPEQQSEFVKLFTDLLEGTYADKMESYNGEKILYTREREDGDNAQVDSKVATKKGEEFSINYKLQSSGGDWKVYDVVIENISLVNNYRSQFNHVLARSSFDDLLQRLRQKQFAAPETKSQRS